MQIEIYRSGNQGSQWYKSQSKSSRQWDAPVPAVKFTGGTWGRNKKSHLCYLIQIRSRIFILSKNIFSVIYMDLGWWVKYIQMLYILSSTPHWRLRLEIFSNAFFPHWSCLRVPICTFAWCFNGNLLLLWGISGGTSVSIQFWTIENLECEKT